jgi:DNA-binding CsgD family transcriptional regulator
MATYTRRAPLLRPFTPMESIVTALLIRGDSRTTIEKKLAMNAWSVNNHLANAAAKIPGDLRCRMRIHFWGRGATVDQLTGEGWMPGPPDREPL